MKKLLFFAIAAIVCISCSKDNDDNNALVGKWEAINNHELIDNDWSLSYTYKPNELVLEFTKSEITQYEDGIKTLSATYSYNASRKEITIDGYTTEIEVTSTHLTIIDKDGDYSYKATYKKI